MSNRIAKLAIFGMARALTLLPPWLYPWCGRLVASLRFLASRDLAILRQNLAVVLDLDPDQRRRLERKVFESQVVVALETLRISRQPELLRLDGDGAFGARLRELEEAGQGQLLLTGHLGGWELLAHASSRALDGGLFALAKPSRQPAVTDFLEDMRRRAGSGVLWTEPRPPLRDMLKVLRRGEMLIFLVDQKPDARRGRRTEFFGRPSEWVAGPATMSERTGAAVTAVACLRVSPFRYRLEFEPLSEPGAPLSRDDLNLETARCLERWIRQAPEQWMWNYRRWYFSAQELLDRGISSWPSSLTPVSEPDGHHRLEPGGDAS